MLTGSRQPTHLIHAMGMEDPLRSILQDPGSLILPVTEYLWFFYNSMPFDSCTLTLCFLISFTVLDWLVQPKPRWLGGNGWLLDGPEEVLQGTAHFTVFSDMGNCTKDCKWYIHHIQGLPGTLACWGCSYLPVVSAQMTLLYRSLVSGAVKQLFFYGNSWKSCARRAWSDLSFQSKVQHTGGSREAAEH